MTPASASAGPRGRKSARPDRTSAPGSSPIHAPGSGRAESLAWPSGVRPLSQPACAHALLWRPVMRTGLPLALLSTALLAALAAPGCSSADPNPPGASSGTTSSSGTSRPRGRAAAPAVPARAAAPEAPVRRARGPAAAAPVPRAAPDRAAVPAPAAARVAAAAGSATAATAPVAATAVDPRTRPAACRTPRLASSVLPARKTPTVRPTTAGRSPPRAELLHHALHPRPLPGRLQRPGPVQGALGSTNARSIRPER